MTAADIIRQLVEAARKYRCCMEELAMAGLIDCSDRENEARWNLEAAIDIALRAADEWMADHERSAR